MLRFLLIIAIIALVAFLSHQFPYAGHGPDDKFRIFYLLALLALIGGGATFTRAELPRKVRDAGLWLLIFGVLMIGYSYRDEIMQTRLVAELMPQRVHVGEDGVLTVRSGDNGHFFIEATVNGQPVKFMVDTGASDVVLSPDDAERLGYNLSQLDFSRKYSTANGVGRGAGITLDAITVGPVRFEHMPASVNQTYMEESLLGMEFLRRFRSFKVTGNTLTLEP